MGERQSYRFFWSLPDKMLGLSSVDVVTDDVKDSLVKLASKKHVRGEIWVAPVDAFEKFLVRESIEVLPSRSERAF